MEQVFALKILLIMIAVVFMYAPKLTAGITDEAEKEGRVYFLSPTGDDANPGTQEAPWASIGKASESAQAGDTVFFLPGIYKGTLAPANNGKPGAPITFRAAVRRTAKLIGDGTNGYTVSLADVSHVCVEGFHIRPESDEGRWLLVSKALHVSIEDCLMEDARDDMPFFVTQSQQVRLCGNVIRGYSGHTHNMARLSNNKYLLIEGNAISRAGHSPFQFYPVRSNRYVVIRGNVFHAGWGRALEIFGDRDVLLEGNIITNSFNGGRSGSTGVNFYTDHGILRFNRIFRNWGGVFYSGPWLDQMFFRDSRIYNNVLHGNFGLGFSINVNGEKLSNLAYVNNILYNNDPHGSYRQLRIIKGEPEELKLMNNVIVGDKPRVRKIIHFLEETYTLKEAEAASEIFEKNLDVEPGFVDAETYNHALLPDSPLLNGGRLYTKTTESGEGNCIPVEDPYYFYDGFGIEGELGDIVSVGSTQEKARVLSVDLDAKKLIVDKELRWEKGDSVSLPWSGERPDIGVYEHGRRGRVSVQVIVDTFIAHPGQEVELRAVVHGLDSQDLKFCWWLGDGTQSEEEELVHTYTEPSDYPIRLQVTDKEGYTYWGAGYLVVEAERSTEEPLLHTTFDRNDKEWWRMWKVYRPAPTRWSREIFKDGWVGEGWLNIFAPLPEDGPGIIPSCVCPVVWDIDKYPIINLRYRVSPGPGTPVGLWLKAFPTPHDGERKVYAALSSSATNTSEDRVGDMVLIDDGEWHELTLDARVIREKYPDIQVIEGMGFDSVGEVPSYYKGPIYSIGEVIIKPEG